MIISARNGQFNPSAVTTDDVQALRDEIAGYFRNIKQEAPATTPEPVSTDPVVDQAPTETPVAKPVVQQPQPTDVKPVATAQAPVTAQPVAYSQEVVDAIFREFSPLNPQPMREFLDAYSKTTQVLPTLIAIYSNQEFRTVMEVENSPKQIHERY